MTSFRKQPWQPAPVPAAEAEGLPAALSGLARRMVSARMSRYGEPLSAWYRPTMRANFPDLFAPADMRLAASIIADAIRQGSTIGLFGDYDADGATSVGVMGRYLAELGIAFHIHIPDRFTEGYGPNLPAIQALVEKGCDLIVVLDSGSTAFEVMDQVAAAGIRAVVIDHHACAPDRKPAALAFVNPNRPDDRSGLGYLCAAGLSFLTCCAVQKLLMTDSEWTKALPDLMGIADIAALGTVADVVPLRGFNRTLVTVGLKVMEQRPNIGIRALAQVSRVQDKPCARDFAFGLGPRINAGGRIGDASLGARLMTCADPEEARELAGVLDQLNDDRKRIEQEVREDAMAKAAALPASRRLILVSGRYHEGVVGITAGRVKESLLKPTIVLSETEHGTLKGSGRSMPGFDLGHAVIAARDAGLLIAGGGHGMAAGLTVSPEKVDELVAFIEAEIAESDFARNGAVLAYDMEIGPEELSIQAIEDLDVLEPFGEGNPVPRFLISGLQLDRVDVVKEVHIRLTFRSAAGKMTAMLFSQEGTPFVVACREAVGQKLDVVASCSINEWRDRKSLELDIFDARPHQARQALAA